MKVTALIMILSVSLFACFYVVALPEIVAAEEGPQERASQDDLRALFQIVGPQDYVRSRAPFSRSGYSVAPPREVPSYPRIDSRIADLVLLPERRPARGDSLEAFPRPGPGAEVNLAPGYSSPGAQRRRQPIMLSVGS